jgi:hypothetical protein
MKTMPDTPADFRSLSEGSVTAIHLCPDCGSFLDAPRINPYDGELSRKCSSCGEWYPIGPCHSGTRTDH